jgi:hypothetical protein
LLDLLPFLRFLGSVTLLRAFDRESLAIAMHLTVGSENIMQIRIC